MEPLHGLLEMLVLQTLRARPLHAYGIAKSIESRSAESLRIEFGSLYPAVKRLELKGLVSSNWETSEHNRRAKYYRLTPAGRRKLQQEHCAWEQFAGAIARIMSPIEEG